MELLITASGSQHAPTAGFSSLNSSQTMQAQPSFCSGETITTIYIGKLRHTVTETYTLHQTDNGWYIKHTKTKQLCAMDVLKSALIFRGNTLPFMVDAQFNVYSSNSKINIVCQNPQQTKSWIRTNNLNPYFTQWDSIHFCTDEKLNLDSVFTAA